MKVDLHFRTQFPRHGCTACPAITHSYLSPALLVFVRLDSLSPLSPFMDQMSSGVQRKASERVASMKTIYFHIS